MFLEETIEKKVSSPKTGLDCYPFGKTLRSFNNTNSFGYQGSKKEPELGDNNYYTHFRGLDADIARWKQVDPKNNFMYTPYSSMNNNPIMNTDVFGDSIRLDDAFKNNKDAMYSYNKFLGTDAGKKFQKDFGSGGKFEHIAVVLTIGKSQTFGGVAETGTDIVGKGGKSEPVEFFEGSTFVENGSALSKNETKDGSYLRFNMKFDYSSYSSGNPQGEHLASNMETFGHEIQHIRISLKTLRESSTVWGQKLQHAEMNRHDGEYYNERYREYTNQFKLWYGDWQNQAKTRPEVKEVYNYIKSKVYAQD